MSVPNYYDTPDLDEDGLPYPTATLDEVHATFTDWLGDDYDTDALDAVLAAAAVEQLDGDPLWLLLISGSGNAKTETAQALAGAGAMVTSTVSSPGALLSATAQKDRAKDATGGLLRKIGSHGVLVIKDVTSILSMNKDARSEVLAALREVYDGHWSRNVGSDGGRTLDWHGRIVVVGAVTTAWDKAHAAISSMGDRFVLVRMDSRTGRQKAGRQAIANTGNEAAMRADLSDVVGALLRKQLVGVALTEDESERLLAAADLVTLARTGVEFDYRGDVIDAHAPEMPTRFAKQLAQVMRGAVALGMDRDHALRLAVRCARDSMPPLRLAIVDDLAVNPGASTTEVRKRLDKPRNTVDRQLQALHMLGVLTCDEESLSEMRTVWRYSLADDIDPTALLVPEKLVPTRRTTRERGDSR
ncbi:winged helix-turn-helix domain-containing protein [Gordonia sp. DT219]|uniref:winged helix-turn-helix domain-containing protein n=1 Tax=Gordonia sp. DT219 TaxID=3416658 RepID=UPI003CEABAD4